MRVARKNEKMGRNFLVDTGCAADSDQEQSMPTPHDREHLVAAVEEAVDANEQRIEPCLEIARDQLFSGISLSRTWHSPPRVTDWRGAEGTRPKRQGGERRQAIADASAVTEVARVRPIARRIELWCRERREALRHQ